LQDGNTKVIRFIGQKLGALGAMKAVEPLLACLKYDDYSKKAIVTALGRLGDKRAIGPLIELLKRNWMNPKGIVKVLGNFGDEGVKVLEGLLEDKNALLRIEVVKELGRRAGSKMVSQLIKKLGDNSKDVQESATYALIKKLGDNSKDVQESVNHSIKKEALKHA